MLQAVAFVFLLALLLSLAPAARVRSWAAGYEWLHWIGFGVWLAGFIVLHRFTIRALPDRDYHAWLRYLLINPLHARDRLFVHRPGDQKRVGMPD